MSRTVTLGDFRTRLRQACEIETDTHLTDTELNDIIALAYAETRDIMIASGLSERFVKNCSFNTVSGTLEYDLHSASIVPDQDFYKIHQLYVNEGNGQLRPLPRIEPTDVQTFRPPASVVAMKLYYIAAMPTLKVAGVFSDAATLDGVSGWEEHTLCVAAIRVKAKREESSAVFSSRKTELEGRIAIMGNTDWSQPARVQRRRNKLNRTWYPYNNQITAYALRADKLELYYSYPWVP